MDGKFFKIKTFGCKVNQYETQVIREVLLRKGYQEADSKEQADICIVNTCTVTQKADRECREALRRFIRENPKAQVVAAGCYVEKDKNLIQAIDPKIELLKNSDKISYFTTSRENKLQNNNISGFKGHTKAFIKVQDGCDNFCSYCKVPYVRGRSKSRLPEHIISEAKVLIKNNYKEIVLTGICLGDFGKDLNDIDLADLINDICLIEGDYRIRLSSIELQDVSDKLVATIKSSSKICNHLHISLQSGDNRILKAMNRKYNIEDFIDRVIFLRLEITDIAITTDVIVGYPGETEEEFNNTIKTLKTIKPSRAHIFRYSPREGTKAFLLKDNISKLEKARRFKILKAITDKYADEFKRNFENKRKRFLIETTRDKATGKLTGYSDEYIRSFFDGPDSIMGTFYNKK